MHHRACERLEKNESEYSKTGRSKTVQAKPGFIA
jgi:hypothetical protein